MPNDAARRAVHGAHGRIRRTVAGLLGIATVALVALPVAGQVRPAGQVVRVGVLSPGSPGLDAGRGAFLQRLNELGWVAGQNLAFEARYAEGELTRLPALAAELVQLKVNLILAFGTPASFAAKHATTAIPVVIFAADPVGTGLVASLARPGGNLTELTQEAGLELAAKRLELLKQVAPGISRVGIVGNPTSAAEARALNPSLEAARRLGLTLIPLGVGRAADFDEAFARAGRERVEGLAIAENALNVEHRHLIVGFAARHRLPAVFGERGSVDAGGLMSYGTDFTDILLRAAGYMDKILRGARAGDLPVEQPTKFELVINVRTARALGLAISPALLLQADRLVE